MTPEEAALLTNRQVKLRLMVERGLPKEWARDFSLLWDDGRPVLQSRPLTEKEFFSGFTTEKLNEILGGRSWVKLTRYNKKIIRNELAERERYAREATHDQLGYDS